MRKTRLCFAGRKHDVIAGDLKREVDKPCYFD